MEAVIFIGIQGTGKSTFYKERFFDTHVRINLDMLKSKHRQEVLLRACLEAKQSFVIDNTNVTAETRAPFIEQSKAAGFRVTGYYFRADVNAALERNRKRQSAARVPDAALFNMLKRLQPPRLEEGFDALFHVQINQTGEFEVREWK
jgi:predicted kinase